MTQIFDALSQTAAQPSFAGQPSQSLNTMPPPMPRMEQQPMYGPMPPMQGSSSGGDTEEIIEAIIDEKWNDLLADINKVVSWKEATEARIIKIEQQMTDMKDQFDKLHQAIVGKVGEYDQHILDVGAEVKAMEKVFSKVLPVFTDNVAELSRITDQMKVKK